MRARRRGRQPEKGAAFIEAFLPDGALNQQMASVIPQQGNDLTCGPRLGEAGGLTGPGLHAVDVVRLRARIPHCLGQRPLDRIGRGVRRVPGGRGAGIKRRPAVKPGVYL